VIELLELTTPVGCHLSFLRRDDRVGVFAEKHATQTLVGEKIRSCALDSKAFESLAALALKFFFGEGGVARNVREHFEQSFRKFGHSRYADCARVGSGVSGEVRAHSPKVFFNKAKGAGGSSGACYAGGDLSQSRRTMRDNGVSTAEEKLRGNFGERAGLD
jgi:hypothetical protein